jgi:hypothetical protein
LLDDTLLTSTRIEGLVRVKESSNESLYIFWVSGKMTTSFEEMIFKALYKWKKRKVQTGGWVRSKLGSDEPT